MKRFFDKVDLFAPSLGDKETIIPCSFDFDLKKKIFKKKKKYASPHLLQKKLWRTTKQFFFWPYREQH